MYESPITYYVKEMSKCMAEERENAIMAKISETIGMDIDKEELIRTLNYDRNQYRKGYLDGKNDILDKLRAEISCHIIEDDTSGNAPDRLRADWIAANIAHMIDLAIFDKYKKESENKE